MAWALLPSLDPRERMRTMRDEFVLTLVIGAIRELRERVEGGGGGAMFVESDGTVTRVEAVTLAEYSAIVSPDPATLFVIV